MGAAISDDDFGRILTGVARDELLIPALTAAMANANFRDFNVPVESFTQRPYDGKFHPSGQATWTVRQLYVYLVAPHTLIAEHFDLTSILAVTQGKFWHHFIQQVLLDLGFLQQFRPDGEVIHPAEVPIDDPEINVRGHADGMIVEGVRTNQLIEIKTINQYKIRAITNETELKQYKYAYWCQAQDYIGVTGADSSRFLFLNADYPFRMTEFVVQRDNVYIEKRRAEYRLAMALAQQYPEVGALQDPESLIPMCCTPKSDAAKKCMARNICPVGRAK